MFSFVVKHLGFLKRVPLLPHLYDSLIKIRVLVTKPTLAKHIDIVEEEVSKWKGASIGVHKYGGSQFNFNAKEIAHIHSNGLLDVLFNKEIKAQLLKEGRVSDHHVFNKSGWISFYIKTEDDKDYALELLKRAYGLVGDRSN